MESKPAPAAGPNRSNQLDSPREARDDCSAASGSKGAALDLVIAQACLRGTISATPASLRDTLELAADDVRLSTEVSPDQKTAFEAVQSVYVIGVTHIMVRKHFGQIDDPENVVAEINCTIMGRLRARFPQWVRDKNPCAPFLVAAAKNGLTDYLRTLTRDRKALAHSFAILETGVDDGEVDRRAIRSYGLYEADVEILRRELGEIMTSDEIFLVDSTLTIAEKATMLGIGTTTAFDRMTKARAKLRMVLR